MNLKTIQTLVYILAISIFSKPVLTKSPEKEYVLEKISFFGNSRIPEKKIREMISFKEGMKVNEKELDFLIKVSKAKMESANLFMFVDMNYEINEKGGVQLLISMGESVIFLDMMALEEGGFTRFSSISEKSPDFGFLVGSKSQALYFRFPYLFKTPLDLATTVTHHSYKMSLNPLNEYDYEAVSGRIALSMTVLPNWKIKLPAIFRYNITGDSQNEKTGDFSTGLETLLDFSHYKNVIYTGFDLNGGVYQGVSPFSYTLVLAGINLYFKPFKWEEIILRGRYSTTIQGSVPEYLLFRIDNEYQVHGKILRNYFGQKRVVFNMENWIRDIVVIPSALTNINFSLLAFVDTGIAGSQIGPLDSKTWNLSVGGAMAIEFSAPLNLALQIGYGHELWQKTGGQFYIKFGYEYRKGNFFE